MWTLNVIPACRSTAKTSVGLIAVLILWSRIAFLPPRNFTAPKPKSPLYPKELKTLGDYLRTRRLDLHLRQSDVAELIGVCSDTIMKWELNQTEPAENNLKAISEFLIELLKGDQSQ